MSLKRFLILTTAVNILKRNDNKNDSDSNFNKRNTTTSTPIETILQTMRFAEGTLEPIPLQDYEKDIRNQNIASTPEVTTTEQKTAKLVSYAHDNYTFAPAIASNVSYVDDDDDDDDDVEVRGSGANSNNSEGIRNYGAPITTTYYGSGFGIFHQQTIRSNGGGIALVTGSGSGVNVNTYAHGVNTNVNLLLGGAMLTLMTTVLCIVCYCCHRSIKKRTEAAYRQQHQWLENDPNMEIYSVEQCYETSGLFLAESTEGLSAMSTLHHEPPPSYDAVVAMQERQQLLMHQQQQQLMLQQQIQRNSPPPGYRSTLDVYSVSQATSALTGASLNYTNEASGSCSPQSADNRLSNACTFQNENTMKHNLCLNTNQLSKQHRALANANLPDLNMKKVLNAQSCCSLQRAEVENMWNAAAAALAARERPTNSSPTIVASVHKSLPYTAMAVANAIKSSSPETFGTRYLKQNSYQSGCPLCGKFRYDDESTHSLSIESGLHNLASGGIDDEEELEAASYHNISREKQKEEKQENNLLQNFGGNGIKQREEEEDGHEEECSCISLQSKQQPRDNERQAFHNNKETANTVCRQGTTPFFLCNNNQTYNDDADDDCEINNCDDDELTVIDNKFINTTALNDSNPGEIILNSKESYSDNNNNSNNNNNQTDRNSNISLLSLASNANSNAQDNNNNSTSELTTTLLNSPLTSCKRPSISTESNNADEYSFASTTLNLDRINENGIISLDMSKIIDKTGLPTYDAALKLESSGYV
ncbi:probable serine/threonine-protein kinase ndrD [Glossina fuscipes]|uniref:Probable serine/threonine-protein kinase ndrD n=1 Tax=Glossina fuscipes TaxID=7396 RepID=A0A9C5Z8G1_9MUSC|nr:probable serine/threonine-protein kinase ndrD [Glossina fuscipes]KAI9576614.1 hypothetical protein GQX74_010596 [Glossina fuscipes]